MTTAILTFLLYLLAVFVGPLLIIWALNITLPLFGFATVIPYTWETFGAFLVFYLWSQGK
jgi:hypothetical protein